MTRNNLDRVANSVNGDRYRYLVLPVKVSCGCKMLLVFVRNVKLKCFCFVAELFFFLNNDLGYQRNL